MITKTWLIVVILAAAAAQRQDPEHPWPDHEPPATYVCVVARNAQAVKNDTHACSCLGMMLEPMCPETPEEMEARINSNRCKSYCKPKQCACRKACLDT